MYIGLSAWAMLFFGGLWAGGILIFAVERTNLWRRMPLDQYAVDFRRSVLRVDPMMPILGAISGVASISFAIQTSGRARAFTVTGLGLLALVILLSILIAEPINSKFRRLREGELPDGAEHYRSAWRSFHAVRTVLALASFGAYAAAVAG